MGKHNNGHAYKVTIDFHTENAAFDENMLGEIGHVLMQARDKATARIESGNDRDYVGTMRDTNGNTVGTVHVRRA